MVFQRKSNPPRKLKPTSLLGNAALAQILRRTLGSEEAVMLWRVAFDRLSRFPSLGAALQKVLSDPSAFELVVRRAPVEERADLLEKFERIAGTSNKRFREIVTISRKRSKPMLANRAQNPVCGATQAAQSKLQRLLKPIAAE
jgi:hypothetical protein